MEVLTKGKQVPALGSWVKNLRTYLKLTQKEIAKRAKVRPADIDLLENNQPLSIETRTRIIKELNSTRLQNWNLHMNC